MLNDDPDHESRLKTILLAPIRGVRWLFLAFIGALNAVNEKAEQLVGRFRSPTDSVSDLSTRMDSFSGRIFSVLVWPFFWIWQIGLRPVVEFFRIPLILQKAGHFTYWLWHPLWSGIVFVRTFVQTRGQGILIWFLPLVLMIVSVALVMWFFRPSTKQLAENYRKATAAAVARGNFNEAHLYQQKLLTLGLPSMENELRQIEDLANSGKTDQAILLAEQLAPWEKAGFPEGHFWLAKIYFQEQAALKGLESLKRAEVHLLRLQESVDALNGQPTELPPNVTLLKAMIEFKKQNDREALSLLNSISSKFWPALILQLEFNVQMGFKENASKDAQKISRLVKRDPSILNELSPQFYPLWCSSLSDAGADEDLNEAIQHWYRMHPENETALVEWSKIQFFEIDNLLVRGSDSDLERATGLLVGISNRLGPKFRLLISAWLFSRLPPEQQFPNYLKLAAQTANHPEVSSTMLEIIGTAATIRGEHELCLTLLKRAIEKDPENAIAWNNLAFVTSESFPADMPLALDAVNRAIQLQPTNVEFLHTRGFIYLQLKKWNLAIEDLSVVVSQTPNASEVHRGLAQAYRAIGNSQLAELHEH
jgi:tetratricopeptide (TPR) repeat protein